MQGKVCVVTGANSGIGKETARALVSRGATVHMVCRDREKGEAAAEELRRTRDGGPVMLHIADLSSQAEIHELADRLDGSLERIDVLVNNAGLVLDDRVLTVDGLETTFAVNHLAYFLLTNRLLQKLVASAPARVVSVASEAHRGARIQFGDLGLENGYSGWTAYCQSKLANILFTFELARRLQGTNVTANCLHPGVIRSNFGKTGPFLVRMLFAGARPFLASNEKGARTSIYLATSSDVDAITGKYFSACREKTPSPEALDLGTAARLWSMSEELTGAGTTTIKEKF